MSKYLDARWQKKRLQILERDEWRCQHCIKSADENEKITFHVHHFYYEDGAEVWDYPDEALITLCSECHKDEHYLRNMAKNQIFSYLSRAGILSIWLSQIVNQIIDTKFIFSKTDVVILWHYLGDKKFRNQVRSLFYKNPPPEAKILDDAGGGLEAPEAEENQTNTSG